MSHHVIRSMISARLDGELSQSEAETLRVHLEHCAECRDYERSLRVLSEGIKSLDSGVSDDWADIVRSVRWAEEESRVWSPVEQVARRFVTGLAVVVLVFISLAMIAQPDEPVVIEPYLAGEQADSSAAALLAREAISKDDLLLAAASRR